VTSSVAAVGPSMDWFQEVGKSGKAPENTKALDESDWSNDEPTDSIRGYRASKVKAEQKAWELSKELGISVVCVNPSFVIGPMLGSRTDGESVGFIKGLLDGTMKEKAAQGNLKGFPKGVVDVRDVSLAHVAAMEKEEADGKRFLLTSESAYTNVKMAQMLSETGKFKAYPLPSESQEGQVGATFNTSRAKEILGFAKNRLNKFYNPKLYKPPPKEELSAEGRIADSFKLTQVGAAPPPPPAAPGPYKKKGEESTGVIAMIDLLVAELDKEMTEAKAEEKKRSGRL